MKITILTAAFLCILMTGGINSRSSGENIVFSDSSHNITMNRTTAMPKNADSSSLSGALLKTYYLAPEDPVCSYLQNHSIQRFFHMWLKEYMGGDVQANWNYDTLAPVQLLDQDFHAAARSGEAFYTCTFSTDDGRCGYIIVSYGEGAEGPYISKWDIHETTPCLYDLRANSRQIFAALQNTDIDLSTAAAARTEWIDTDRNRKDSIILFTDGKADKYICYLGTDDLVIEKK